jgi:hypothetical protein
MMNSNREIRLVYDHGGYEVKEDLKESGPFRSSSTGLNSTAVANPVISVEIEGY